MFQVRRDTFRDFTLAIACGCGSAFFVGTDLRYQGNWLQIIVGERTGRDALDVFKAALSTFLGFNVGMLILMMIFPLGSLWVDAAVGAERQNVDDDGLDVSAHRPHDGREAAQEKLGGYSILDA
jgi:hypothetical protein